MPFFVCLDAGNDVRSFFLFTAVMQYSNALTKALGIRGEHAGLSEYPNREALSAWRIVRRDESQKWNFSHHFRLERLTMKQYVSMVAERGTSCESTINRNYNGFIKLIVKVCVLEVCASRSNCSRMLRQRGMLAISVNYDIKLNEWDEFVCSGMEWRKLTSHIDHLMLDGRMHGVNS